MTVQELYDLLDQHYRSLSETDHPSSIPFYISRSGTGFSLYIEDKSTIDIIKSNLIDYMRANKVQGLVYKTNDSIEIRNLSDL